MPSYQEGPVMVSLVRGALLAATLSFSATTRCSSAQGPTPLQTVKASASARETVLANMDSVCLSVDTKKAARGYCAWEYRTEVDGPRERWRRKKTWITSEVFAEVSAATEFPDAAFSRMNFEEDAFSIYDGQRTLEIVREAKGGLFWTGQLRRGSNNEMRRGAFACGWLFGEEWLSKCLTDWECVGEASEKPSTSRLEFAFSRGATSKQRIIVEASTYDGFPQLISWRKPIGELESAEVFRCEIRATTLLNGVRVPLLGKLTYGHRSGKELSECMVFFGYKAKLAKVRDVFATRSLPDEIRALDGTVCYRDALTEELVVMGPQDRLPPGFVRALREASPLPVARGGPEWPWLLVSAVLASLLIGFGLYMRALQRRAKL